MERRARSDSRRRPLQSRNHAGCSTAFRRHVAQREIGRPVRREDGRGSRRHRDYGFTATEQQPRSSSVSGPDRRDATVVDMARIAARSCSTSHQGICTTQLLSRAATFQRHPAASHSDGPRHRCPTYLHSQPVNDGRRQPPWPLIELRRMRELFYRPDMRGPVIEQQLCSLARLSLRVMGMTIPAKRRAAG